MAAQDLNVQVIANNIANINTTGFKRARAEFTDLLYQTERLQGVSSRGQNNTIPEGAQLGLGVRTAAIRNLHIQGTLANTGNKLDLALNGRGWFEVTGANNEIVYTRTGSFSTDATGQLVTADGYTVSPGLLIPQNAIEVTINESGEVSATVSGQVQPQTVGQLTLVNFANEAGLRPLGNNLYRQTEASGQPISGVPGDPGFATVSQGYLESSNVDPVKEITDLIAAQRAYEMNSKVIEAASEMASTVSKGTA
jgi:flagellar basal-body rod protein FlgG